MKLVVVGNGMGSVRMLEHLAEGHHQHDIVVLSEESSPGYNRILLSKLLAGSIDRESIELKARHWYQEHGIRLLSNKCHKVTGIDRTLKQVKTVDGEFYPYDKLILATGSRPVSIPVGGANLQGVMFFRQSGDVDLMLESARKENAKAVVIGGGLLGLECASGLVKRGMSVTVVDTNPTLLGRQLDGTAGEMLRSELETRGIAFRCGARLQQYLGNQKGWVQQVEIINDQSQQEYLDASLVVVAAGVRPEGSLMQSAGLECDRGVMVNENMQTSDPDIFAFGECVQLRDSLFGLVAPVYEQAQVVSEQLLGRGSKGFVPVPIPTRLKVDGIDLFSCGEFIAGEGDEELLVDARQYGVYRKIVIHNNRIKGVLLYGDVSGGQWYQNLMLQSDDISSFRQQLIFGQHFLPAA
ncbi:NAD(P)/FAD-dependent oxidoreductase [Endozoicomonas montiporae]|uniref:Assimilatory nitrate reductase electron transfer subunit domain protein n=1 Tax=Endozoicomonas montiporae CL-33 TaxID=570277 RepID=A0A142BAL3_9GAMM|nr:FAD-dependent oxidoreductase [Endozoicomonas montiporae]AMO55789.1 assimilatory nitrate reductase electron transfer subunit domain protein [Endozoicomonas montiporae CL-33]